MCPYVCKDICTWREHWHYSNGTLSDQSLQDVGDVWNTGATASHPLMNRSKMCRDLCVCKLLLASSLYNALLYIPNPTHESMCPTAGFLCPTTDMSYYRYVLLQVCPTTDMSYYWIPMFNRRVKLASIHLATYTVLGM